MTAQGLWSPEGTMRQALPVDIWVEGDIVRGPVAPGQDVGLIGGDSKPRYLHGSGHLGQPLPSVDLAAPA